MYVDSKNIESIENFYKENSCKEVYYYKSRYKAICKDKIVVIKNQFSVDFSSNVIIKYSDIIDFKINEKSLNIKTSIFEDKLYFETQKDTADFYSKLNIKLNQK